MDFRSPRPLSYRPRNPKLIIVSFLFLYDRCSNNFAFGSVPRVYSSLRSLASFGNPVIGLCPVRRETSRGASRVVASRHGHRWGAIDAEALFHDVSCASRLTFLPGKQLFCTTSVRIEERTHRSAIEKHSSLRFGSSARTKSITEEI